MTIGSTSYKVWPRMGFRDRLEGGAKRLGAAAQDAATSSSLQRAGEEAKRLGAAAQDAATSGSWQRAGDGFRGLREMFADKDEKPTTVERFLLRLVRAVRDDETNDERSARDVFETARRRRRRLGLASFGAGPLIGVANQLSDLYCETATLCDLAGVHSLSLDDGEIAAHMLLLWSVTDTLDEAQVAVSGRGDGSLTSILAHRLGDAARDHVPDKLTKRSAIKALWDARGVVDDVTNGNRPGAVSTVVFTGHHMKKLIKRAELQLGVTGTRDATRASTHFSRKSEVDSCFLCSERVEHSEMMEHYATHLIEVTDNNGYRAFTFDCPRCGLMDEAWGGGRPDPESNGANAIVVHLMQSHGVPML